MDMYFNDKASYELNTLKSRINRYLKIYNPGGNWN